MKNPVPFNPHSTLTGSQAVDLLDVLQSIFQDAINKVGDGEPTEADLKDIGANVVGHLMRAQ